MTIMDRPLRATPLYRAGFVPEPPRPTSYRMRPEVLAEVIHTLRNALPKGHPLRAAPLPPMPPPEPAPSPDPVKEPADTHVYVGGARLPDLFDKLCRALDMTMEEFTGWRRGPYSAKRQLAWAVMRSFNGPTGTPSLPEIAKLTRPRGEERRQGCHAHTTIMTALKKWAHDPARVEQAAVLAWRVGLGEDGMARVRALAAQQQALKERDGGKA